MQENGALSFPTNLGNVGLDVSSLSSSPSLTPEKGLGFLVLGHDSQTLCSMASYALPGKARPSPRWKGLRFGSGLCAEVGPLDPPWKLGSS